MVRPAFALLVVGCIAGRHPVEGKACDGVHPCPDELLCYNRVCTAVIAAAGGGADAAAGGAALGTGGGGTAGGEAGGSGAQAGGAAGGCPNNLLKGGGFEEGQLSSLHWSGAFTAQSATVRTGAWAARLAPATSSTVTLESMRFNITAVEDREHCAEAWVRATGASGPIVLQLGRWLATVELSPEMSVTADGTWQRLTNRFAYPSGLAGFTLHVKAPLFAGGEAFVDDVCVQLCP